jgi:pyridoxal phosphate-dependent aminotransferase EpsN
MTHEHATRIYLSVPHMGDLEQRYVHEAFQSNWLSTVGPNLDAFERDFSNQLLEGRSCVALASGTAGMHLGLRLLGVGPDDDVLCPTLTFIGSVNPVRFLGARPVFVDSERASWNVDPALLRDVAQRRTREGKRPKAIIVVHLYGQSADLDPIMELSRELEIPVLEDAAEAVGTLYRGRPVGVFGDVGVFSFNGNKIITTTGGGLLTARDAKWVEKARFWSQQARDPGIAYEHTDIGYNYRLSNVLAGIGRGQLAVLGERVAARRRIAFRYRDALADLPGIALMPQAEFGLHTNWLSVFLVDEARFGRSRDEIIAALSRENIEARPVWKPMHLQPVNADCPAYGGEVAEDLFRRGICLPSSSSLTELQQDRVIGVIRGLVTL